MVLSMLSVSLLLNTQSPASSQSPTRRFIPSAQKNCWRWSMRVNIPLSSYGTRPSTRCRGTTSLSSRRWYPLTTCVWDASAEVRGSQWREYRSSLQKHCIACLLHSTLCMDWLLDKRVHMCMHVFMCVHVNVKCFCGVHACMLLCWSHQNLVVPHQCVCIRGEEKQALWLVCGSSKCASYTLDWVGEKKENYCFCQSDTRSKATTCSLLATRPLCKAVQVV